jgi:hypothetical protein
VYPVMDSHCFAHQYQVRKCKQNVSIVACLFCCCLHMRADIDERMRESYQLICDNEKVALFSFLQ